MPLYRTTLAYDGTEYHGWQVQPGRVTLQGTIEEALGRMAEHAVRVVAAGRTDAGVHAHAQVAHFDLRRPIPAAGLRRGLNSMLPRDIRVLDVREAPDGFHARYSARSKTYHYYLHRAPVMSPFRLRYAHHYPHALDREAMDEAAARFVGRRDFSAFRAASCDARTSVRECTISRLFDPLEEGKEGSELVYEVSADGFLRHMVRNLMGTLLEIGGGRLQPADIEELFAARDRRLSGPTAPAHGLHLIRVEY